MAVDIDSLLKDITQDLPPEWIYTRTEQGVQFTTTGEIFILQENKVNAPVTMFSSSDENAQRIRKLGKKTKAALNFKITPYRNSTQLEELKSKPVFYRAHYLFILEDEFHSVFPFEIPGQIYAIKNIIRKHLATVFAASDFTWEDYTDKQVLLTGSFSDMPWQHLMLDNKTYRYSEYFDIDHSQIVAYFKQPPDTKKKQAVLAGTLVRVKGLSKKPGIDDAYQEYAILVDEVLKAN